MDSQAFCPPAYLTASHELALFQSDEEALDNWLQDRALDNMKTGATSAHVNCASGSSEAISYYAT